MKTLKVGSLVSIIMLVAFTSQAQQKYDYPQLKNYSPLGISTQGVFYNKINSYHCQHNGEYYSCNERTMDLDNNKTFSYSVGIDYTFYRANQLSFILNASVDVISKPIFNKYAISDDYTKCDIEKWTSTTYPSLSFLMQYRQSLLPKLYLNAKGGLKILGNIYNIMWFKDEADIIHNLNKDIVNPSHYNASVLLGVGLSYANKFALIDFDLLGNFSLGPIINEMYVIDSEYTGYSIKQSGTYWGVGITIHPRMWWKK